MINTDVYNESGCKVDLADQFLTLDHEESTDFVGFVKDEKGMLTPLRFCAYRKSVETCAATQKKLKRKASRKRVTVSEKTELFNQFVVVVTSLPAAISAADILETYRLRWQVECYFKRLKSIMDFGELPKKRDSSSLSWLNGKIMVALMTEMLLAQLSFSP